MGNLIVMVGAPGSGKDTWIREEISNTDKSGLYVVHSSDDIRKELFGALVQDRNGVVFDTMRKRTFKDLEEGKNVIWNATNVSRKRRVSLYQDAKRKGHNVGIVYMCRSLDFLMKSNENRPEEDKVPKDVIKRMYTSLQIPREGADCDSMIMIGDAFFSEDILENYYGSFEDLLPSIKDEAVLDEILLNYAPHDTPYHLESINEHINMTIDAAQSPNMKLLALFHDLGKGVCKNGGRYIGHENVSAQYMYNALWHANSANFDLAEVVLQHMNAHNGFSDRVISRNALTKEIMDLALFFAKNIDAPSRIQADQEGE